VLARTVHTQVHGTRIPIVTAFLILAVRTARIDGLVLTHFSDAVVQGADVIIVALSGILARETVGLFEIVTVARILVANILSARIAVAALLVLAKVAPFVGDLIAVVVFLVAQFRSVRIHFLVIVVAIAPFGRSGKTVLVVVNCVAACHLLALTCRCRTLAI